MTKSRRVGPIRVRPQIKSGKETGKWFVDIPASLTGDGNRKRKLFNSQKQAMEVTRGLRRRRSPVIEPLRVARAADGITLQDTVEDWKRDQHLCVQTLKKRETTFEVEKYRLRCLSAYFGDRALCAISERRLMEYRAHRLEQGRRPVTINAEIATLGLVFRWAVKQGRLSDFPRTTPVPVRPARVVIPSPEKVVRIIRALPERLKPLVWFLAETGCRKGEAINLTGDYVDLTGGYVEIASREGWTPKTQQSERHIPLSANLLAKDPQPAQRGPLRLCGQDTGSAHRVVPQGVGNGG